MDTSDRAQFEEEEAISGTGEGDEIMEEVEEQEDGYSACFHRAFSLVDFLVWIISVLDTHFNIDLD